MTNAKLIVRRPPGDVLGARYAITLTLNGTKIGRLGPGESVSREVTPGHHRLRVWNTLVWKNAEFDVEPGGVAAFVTANRTNLLSELAAFIGFGLLGVTLEREVSP